MLSQLGSLLVVMVMGGAQKIGSAINGKVARSMGLQEATFLFLAVGSAWALCLALLLEGPRAIGQLASLPWYLYAPGLTNFLVVLLIIRSVNTIGVTLTGAGMFTGQMLSSLTLDHLGVLGLSPISVNLARVLGAMVLLGGIAQLARTGRALVAASASASGEVPLQAEIPPDVQWKGTVITILLGGFLSLIGALNASVGLMTGPFSATTLFLLPGAILFSFRLLMAGRVRSLLLVFSSIWKSRSWLYLLPGSVNVLGVAGIVFFVPRLGLQVVSGTAVASGMVTALVVDHIGLLGLNRYPLGPGRLKGALLLALGVTLSVLGTH